MNVSKMLCAALSCIFVSACGGGGTGTGTPVKGIAMLGPLNGSSVCAYVISGGVQGAKIGNCATTDSTGNYHIDLGAYKGSVLFQTTGGSYVDEATGATVILSSPLHGMIINSTSAISSPAITALTELAYQYANALAGGLTNANMQSAINTVQNNFGVSDIVNTMPVNALNVPSGATAAQKSYSLSLAALSQYLNGMAAGTTLSNSLQTIEACLAAPTTSCGVGAASVGALLNTAMSTFVSAHPAFPGVTAPFASFGSTTTPPDSNLPSAPTGVIATSLPVTISWNAVTGATSYNVYYSPTPGVTITNGTKVVGATSGVSMPRNLLYYFFIVTAVNSNGESKASSEVQSIVLNYPL